MTRMLGWLARHGIGGRLYLAHLRRRGDVWH